MTADHIPVYAPSYRRADGVLTQKYLPFVKYVVADFEADDYLAAGHDVWVVPDEAQGNLCRIRNWILDHCESDQVVIIDDDMTGVFRWQKQKPLKLGPDEFLEFIEMAVTLVSDLDIRFWGMNLLPDKGAYREYTPFSFKSMICGPFQAFNRLDLRYDENLPLKEDYDLSLQVLNKYRRTFRFNAYYYQVKQHENTGGCADYRTLEREKEQLRLLQKKWGSRIVREDRQSAKSYDINPIIKVPIKGI